MATLDDHHENAQGARGDPERLCDLILKSARIGVIVLDAGGRVIGSNDTARTVLGGEAQAWDRGIASIVHQLKRMPETGGPGQGTLTLASSHGTIRHVSFAGELVGGDGELVVWLLDATMTAEERRRQVLTEELTLLEKMAARLGHKINNHLGSLLAGLQMLEKGTCRDDEDLLVVNLLLDEAGALNQEVRAVLESLRSEVAAVKPVPVERLLNRAVGDLRAEATHKGITLSLVSAAPDVFVHVDEAAMLRGLRNLLGNALEASTAGGRIVVGRRILGESEKREILPAYTGGVVTVFIEDRGCGLPKEVPLSSLYEPLVTTKPSRMGIGLTVAREIVETHGGLIQLKPSAAGGTSCEVLMPTDPCAPCWDVRDRGGCPRILCEHSCEGCDRKTSGSPHLCWTLTSPRPDEGADEPAEECTQCEIFRSRHLASFFRPAKRDTKG